MANIVQIYQDNWSGEKCLNPELQNVLQTFLFLFIFFAFVFKLFR